MHRALCVMCALLMAARWSRAKKVTGFTNSEEAAVGLTDVVPFLVEDELKAKGGVYSRGDDWALTW